MSAGHDVGLPDDPPAAHDLRTAAEGLLLVLVACSPWVLGSTVPRWEFFLSLGVLASAALWPPPASAPRRFTFRLDPVSLCLLGLVLLTAFQLFPLPPSVVRVLSPTAAEWHRTL